MASYILSIDQGTTSSRAIVFNKAGQICGVGQQEFTQHFPNDGWVEHSPEDIWQTTLSSCNKAISEANLNASNITAIGISNQRETTLVWDKNTSKPVYNAIVWQDRRTADFCAELKQQNLEPLIQSKTGLLIDPYFSATKLRWILNNVEHARDRAEKGELIFGTVDTFLLWRLTGGASHKTDATNASRTLLFNIHSQCWDEELLELFNIPASMLPSVEDCSADFGTTAAEIFDSPIAITGIAGDQQAALFGQACFQPGMAKSTYGTGCFLMLNTGSTPVTSNHKLLTTIGYRLKGKVTYAIEGSIFIAGAAIQWLRDGLKLITDAKESEKLANQAGTDHGIYLVPAFTGLGAPYWDPDARGAIFGLTRDTGIAEIVTAALQSVGYQTKDLVNAMTKDGAEKSSNLRVDGGMANNDWMMQFLADILQTPIERPSITETTALGVAYLAGLQAGIYDSLEEISELWQKEKMFSPMMNQQQADQLYHGWNNAVQKVLTTT